MYKTKKLTFLFCFNVKVTQMANLATIHTLCHNNATTANSGNNNTHPITGQARQQTTQARACTRWHPNT